MKNISKKIAALALSIAVVQSVHALPNLQVDISDGVYDPVTETTVSTSPIFDVLALAQNPGNLMYYLSAAVTPNPGQSGTDFGSFKVNGNVFNSVNMTFGTPPIEEVDGELASHGIFPTYFAEFAFKFDGGTTVPAYNVQDGTSAPGSLFLKTFAIDMTGMAEGYNVHFDLYTYGDKGGKRIAITDFAPFSHDGEGRNVPDGGATAVLLGLGVAGLAMVRRARKA